MTISIYLLIMIICAIFLFIILFIGDFDMGDMDVDMDIDTDVDGGFDIGHGPSMFSLPVLLSVGTSFGAFGLIFENSGFNEFQTPFFSIILAIAVGALTFLGMWKMFKSTESSTRVNFSDMLGMKATVTIAIRDGEEGQIVVIPPERGRILVGAISDEDIDTDEPVRIIELIGDVMKVKRIGKGRRKKVADRDIRRRRNREKRERG